MIDQALRFYSSPNQKEIIRRLQDIYVANYISRGMSKTQAKEHVEEMLQMAIYLSVDANTYNLPPNLGDIIVGNSTSKNDDIEKFADSIRQQIDYLNKEGVKEEDIRKYWNLNELERRMAQVEDNNSKTVIFIKERKSGKSVEEASKKVRKFLPIYGLPSDENQPEGDDQNLPVELKDRVNKYIESRSVDISSYKEDVARSTSFNALIRNEIKAGNL
jgi:hypothetical protein